MRCPQCALLAAGYRGRSRVLTMLGHPDACMGWRTRAAAALASMRGLGPAFGWLWRPLGAWPHAVGADAGVLAVVAPKDFLQRARHRAGRRSPPEQLLARLLLADRPVGPAAAVLAQRSRSPASPCCGSTADDVPPLVRPSNALRRVDWVSLAERRADFALLSGRPTWWMYPAQVRVPWGAEVRARCRGPVSALHEGHAGPIDRSLRSSLVGVDRALGLRPARAAQAEALAAAPCPPLPTTASTCRHRPRRPPAIRDACAMAARLRVRSEAKRCCGCFVCEESLGKEARQTRAKSVVEITPS